MPLSMYIVPALTKNTLAPPTISLVQALHAASKSLVSGRIAIHYPSHVWPYILVEYLLSDRLRMLDQACVAASACNQGFYGGCRNALARTKHCNRLRRMVYNVP